MRRSAAAAKRKRRARSLALAGPNELRLVRENDGLHPIADVELAQDVRDVRLHRVLAHDERGRDLCVREAAGDELDDFEFSRRELLEPARRARLP